MSSSKPSQGQDENGGVYATPLEFLSRVNSVFPICFDLAADATNNAVFRLSTFSRQNYFDESDGALTQDWVKPAFDGDGWCWLNPPFANIEPWAKKCAEESARSARILLLVPQGSQNWNLEHCQGKSLELRLTPRMKFDGHPNLYPKDLSLFVFGAGITGTGFWNWRKA